MLPNVVIMVIPGYKLWGTQVPNLVIMVIYSSGPSIVPVCGRQQIPALCRACHGPTLVGRAGAGPGRTRRPRPARQIFRGWAAARPSPSHFQKFTARPDPSHHFFPSLGPAQPVTWYQRPMRHGLYMGHVLSRTINRRCMCIR